MKAIVFAGAKINEYSFCEKYLAKKSLIVCCDSGLHHVNTLGLKPDAIVGDFDSVDMKLLNFYKNKGIAVSEFPTHKDETDMELGIDKAIELGADNIIIFGGIGSRMDHTMANCHYLLYLLKNGIKAKLVDEKNEIFVIDKECTLFGKKGDIVSTIPLSMEVKGVTTYNLEYPLYNATLKLDGRLIAVSNIMIGDKAKITIEEGYLLVMQCRD